MLLATRRLADMLDRTRMSCHVGRHDPVVQEHKTERFVGGGRNRFAGLDEQKARLRLDQLNAAVTPQSMGVLKSIGLHMLKGSRAGYWAVTINGPWRLVFRFADGDAHDVEIVDYH